MSQNQKNLKISLNYCLVLSAPSTMKILLVIVKQKLSFSCSELFHIKTKACPKYFVNDCLWKQFLPSTPPQTH